MNWYEKSWHTCKGSRSVFEKIYGVEQYDQNPYTDDSIQDNHVTKTVPRLGRFFPFMGKGLLQKFYCLQEIPRFIRLYNVIYLDQYYRI